MPPFVFDANGTVSDLDRSRPIRDRWLWRMRDKYQILILHRACRH
jgi:hypothetical protein